MSVFYSIDSARVSHREYWWGSRSPLVLVGWLLKWLRVRISSSTDDPNVDDVGPFVVEALPAGMAVRFGPVAAELAALGFVDPVYHQIYDAGTGTTWSWATFRHESGRHLARIHHRLWQQATTADRGLFVQFFTPRADGAFVASSSGKPDLDTPPTVPMLRRRGAAPAALWAAHQEFVAAQGGPGGPPVATREDLIAAIGRLHALLRDYHLARGVFRPRTAEEESTANVVADRLASATTGGARHPDVQAEVERINTQRPGWGNAIVILVVSVLAFVGAGSAQKDWDFYLWLVPLLFLHEGGHWLAMKVFGYRNLRMFFIPLFGAAVTGRHYNVPGWKKAIVSLAGPVPGIVLGTGLAVVGFITHREWLNQAAFFLIVINGFNLLPVLPLDGGHVLHAILFCRNRWLDIAFRGAAAAGLLLLSFTGTGRIFLFLAIFMAMGLPVAFKLGKVIDVLRRNPLPPPIPGEDRIPTSAVDAITDALKAELPANTNARTLAMHVVNAYETLNARPPGVAATLGFLAVHGVSALLVLVFGMLLVIDRHGGGLGNFARAALLQPRHAVECGTVERWTGPRFHAGPARHLLVATLEEANARGEFRTLTNQLPPDATLTRFGPSLLLTLPATDDAARERWVRVLQRSDTNAFVVLTNRGLTVSLMAVAPSGAVATNTVEELRHYLDVAHFGGLIAPWSEEATGAGYEAIRENRRAWHAIGTNVVTVWAGARNQALNRQVLAAHKRGATDEANRLLRDQEEANQQARTLIYERLRQEGYDSRLLELHAMNDGLSFTNRAERQALAREIAQELGPARSRDLGAGSGSVRQNGILLEMNWVRFDDAPAGLPACLDWLCRRGFNTFKYEILSGADPLDGFEE